MFEEIKTTRDAAIEKGYTDRYIRSLIQQGRLRAIKTSGGHYLIQPADLDDLRARRSAISRPPAASAA
jgi:excisionase family DNA binding protein